MKKSFLLGLCVTALFAAIPTIASGDDLFDYGFLLSCGQTVYRSFDHQLSTAELVEWTDFFEDTICGGTTPYNPGIE